MFRIQVVHEAGPRLRVSRFVESRRALGFEDKPVRIKPQAFKPSSSQKQLCCEATGSVWTTPSSLRAGPASERSSWCARCWFLRLGAEYPIVQKRLTSSIMVGLYKPEKVKGYLLSYYPESPMPLN